MTMLRNNFDGGPDGTTITLANSGQVPGNDAFNTMSTVGSQTVIQYADAANLGRGTAEFVMKTSTGTSTNSCGVVWTTSMGSQSQVWWRQYINLTILPVDSGAGNDMTIFECDNGAVYMGFCDLLRTTGKLIVRNGPQTSSVTTTNALVLNSWARVEARYKFGTGTAGEFDLSLYLDADSDSPTESISATGWNMAAATANFFTFGSGFNDVHKPLTYWSGLEINNTGFPGPAPFKARGVPGIQPNPIAVHTDTR
jgi:hypothetical protein